MKKILCIFVINLFQAQQTWNLQNCLEYVSAHHPLVKQATVNIQKNDRQIAASKGILLPSFNTGVNHSYSFGSSINQSNNQREALNSQYDQISVKAEVYLLNWRNYLNISLSKLNRTTSTYKLKQVQNEVKLNVVQTFFAYQNSKSWLEVLETQISGIEEQIKRTENEVEIGNRSKSDIYDIKANLGTLQEQWVSAKNKRDLAKINLFNALSMKEETLDFVITEDGMFMEDFSSLEFTRELIENNPAYKTIMAEIKAQEKNIRIEKSAYIPTLGANYSWSTFYNTSLGTHSISNANFSDQFSQNKNQSISFSLNIPIFNRFQVKNNVEIAKLNVLNFNYDKELIINDLTRSINSIKTQFFNAQEKYNLLELNFENQKLSFQKSEEKYKEGLMDAYTFFVVRNNWLQANFNLISSKNDVIQQMELLKILKNGL